MFGSRVRSSRLPGRARPADVTFAVAACIALAGYNNLAGVQPWHRRWYPVVNGFAAGVMLGAAAASGLTADDLGLRRDRLRAGLRLGSSAAAPVVAAFGLGALVPATRPLLNDQRVAGLDRRQLAYQVLLRIPVGTVAWEEIAFRGVLQAALRRVLAEPTAIAVGSAVFGLWHVRPTIEALEVNRLAAQPRRQLTGVEGVIPCGRKLVESPDPAAVLRRRLPAPARAARVGDPRIGRHDPGGHLQSVQPQRLEQDGHIA
jgi:uncharacterized protein